MPIVKKIKQRLEESNLYMRFRYSRIVFFLWLLYRNDVRQDIAKKEKWYQSVLPLQKELVFDIGANEGILTKIFSKHAKRIVAVEPSARNQRILQAKFQNNPAFHLLHSAVSDENGELSFYEDRSNYALGTVNEKWNHAKPDASIHYTQAVRIQATTLDYLIDEFGKPDYIKIDVEGNEWNVIKGLSDKVSLLSFEAILPLFLEETKDCINHLSLLSPNCMFNLSAELDFLFKKEVPKTAILEKIQHLNVTTEVWCWM